MNIPALELETSYSHKNNDLLLVPYLDGTTSAADVAVLPQPLQNLVVGQDPGAQRVAFAGSIDGDFLLALSVRLDDDTLPVAENMKNAAAKAMERARKEKFERVVVVLDAAREELILAAHEGLLLGGYTFETYKEKKSQPVTAVISVTGTVSAALQKKLEQAEVVVECMAFARDVLNEPPNVIHPPSLAQAFMKMGEASGLKMDVWDEKRIEQENCGGVLSVGKGAANQPRMVIGRYTPAGATDDTPHLALVGKGVTFDTGGYSLKPPTFQVGMKYDMGGAAGTFAAACAIARLQLPVRVTVITPMAENDVSSTAYHVSDVVTTRSGKTVEILNTDAEGRMLLADGLTLACEESPDLVVDAATLTGSAVVALGEDIAALYGNDQASVQLLLEAGEKTGEPFCQLPLYAPYAEKLKSEVADLNNTGKTREGGSILAALFLQNWIKDGQKWLHLDIAGPGGKEDELGPIGKGGKGHAVRTLVALAEKMAQ